MRFRRMISQKAARHLLAPVEAAWAASHAAPPGSDGHAAAALAYVRSLYGLHGAVRYYADPNAAACAARAAARKVTS